MNYMSSWIKWLVNIFITIIIIIIIIIVIIFIIIIIIIIIINFRTDVKKGVNEQ